MGKLLGAVLGFMAMGPLGLLLGLLAGYVFDRNVQQRGGFNSSFGYDRERAQQVFFETVFTLLGYLAKADGRVSEEEVAQTEQFMAKMGLTSDHRREAINLFKQGSRQDFNIDQLMQDFNVHCGRQFNLKQMVLVYLINVAMADGELHSAEQDVLRDVASRLGFSGFAFEQLLRMINAQNQFRDGQYQGYTGGNDQSNQQTGGFGSFGGKSELDLAYEALGVEASINDKDLKKAYRKLMSQYHPDKLMGQGVPEDMIEEATERSKEIQAAYDLIKKSR